MTAITNTDLRNKSIGLYTPPFRFEHGYIWDAKGRMVADNHVDGEDAALRVRGWGRISYMENPEELQDEVGNVIALAMTEFWERRKAERDSEQNYRALAALFGVNTPDLPPIDGESRTVKLPPKIDRDDADGWFLHKGGRVGGGAAEWYNKALDDFGAELTAAGIKWEDE